MLPFLLFSLSEHTFPFNTRIFPRSLTRRHIAHHIYIMERVREFWSAYVDKAMVFFSPPLKKLF